MNTQVKGHFAHSLSNLIKRYSLSDRDLKKLQNIEDDQIVSLAYTDYGGFDFKTGVFYAEEREINYKVKIKYLINTTGELKMMILLPVVNPD